MNTIETYFKESETRVKISKTELLRRIEILSDVVQALMDRIGEKDGVQLGVMATAATKGLKFIIYQEPLLQCSICNKNLPIQKEGEPTYLKDNVFVCEECFKNNPK